MMSVGEKTTIKFCDALQKRKQTIEAERSLERSQAAVDVITERILDAPANQNWVDISDCGRDVIDWLVGIGWNINKNGRLMFPDDFHTVAFVPPPQPPQQQQQQPPPPPTEILATETEMEQTLPPPPPPPLQQQSTPIERVVFSGKRKERSDDEIGKWNERKDEFWKRQVALEERLENVKIGEVTATMRKELESLKVKFETCARAVKVLQSLE